MEDPDQTMRSVNKNNVQYITLQEKHGCAVAQDDRKLHHSHVLQITFVPFDGRLCIIPYLL